MVLTFKWFELGERRRVDVKVDVWVECVDVERSLQVDEVEVMKQTGVR